MMYRILLTLVLLLLLLSACAPGMNDHRPDRPAGFLWGIWHGWIAPFSLIYSFFVPQSSIYEVNNSGFFYDLGYYLAVVGGFGSLTFSRRARKKQRD
ncbi:MAG: hypothetical protein PHO32_09845 [Candidatus Cloacimonetes bacterium]|nr:hypothetical protein [Candidatus Cloacimonadota bacterium]